MSGRNSWYIASAEMDKGGTTSVQTYDRSGIRKTYAVVSSPAGKTSQQRVEAISEALRQDSEGMKMYLRSSVRSAGPTKRVG